MNYLLVATPVLFPYINKLVKNTPHHIQVVESGPDVQQLIDQTTDVDAIILANGEALIKEQGLTAREIPLVIPRVHNEAALLLGGADQYRGLFERYQPGICYLFPQTAKPVYYGAQQECDCLCHLVDTIYGCKDLSLAARELAQAQGYDYIEQEIDDRLCMDLLLGNWAEYEDIITVNPGETAVLTYTHALVEVQ